jgi:hypothetical protein
MSFDEVPREREQFAGKGLQVDDIDPHTVLHVILLRVSPSVMPPSKTLMEASIRKDYGNFGETFSLDIIKGTQLL